jgi:thiamine biosynthesis lipoprotein ApbE
MFIAGGPLCIALRRSAMGTTGKDERKFLVRDKNESHLSKPADGTPPERSTKWATCYKHRTPPE